ncbi:MAG TPA: hypothetical protein VFB94_02735 [Acidimicrobiales bacterium]|nr:hypothetical protein [Acidimicrobiales bacterium]
MDPATGGTVTAQPEVEVEGSPSPATAQAYDQTCATYRAIDDFRAKLLGFLPLASGGGVFLVAQATESDGGGGVHVAAGLFGFVVTLGLLSYEIFGIKRCHYLIEYGRRLEWDMKLRYGQFQQRPHEVVPKLGSWKLPVGIDEPVATALIYPAVLAGWAFVAVQPGSTVGAAVASLSLFIVGFGLIVWWDTALRKEALGWRSEFGPTDDA